MLCKRWTKTDKNESPYYWKYVKRFNSFSYWIQYVILSQESLIRRVDVAKTFLKIAMICIKTFRNYCSSHYIFSALLMLRRHKIISFELEEDRKFGQLEAIFLCNDAPAKVYEEKFKTLNFPAIPGINTFLKIFLKLQDGVTFTVKWPESSHRYIKFR